MKDKLEEYTEEEIERFGQHFQILKEYNDRIEQGEPVAERPPLSEKIIAELSYYYTLKMEKEIEDYDKTDSMKSDA